MRKLSIMLILLAIVGCAAPHPQLEEPRIVRVEVPVQVPCKVQHVAEPIWAADVVTRSDSLEVKVRALLAERHQRIGYVAALKAAIDGCK